MKKVGCLLFVGVMCATSALALELEFGTASTGDGGHGFGILAEYPDGGPRTLTITRNTLPGFPKPDYWKRWGRLCNLSVYDPDGISVAYLEMGDQAETTRTYTVKIPRGKAGVWRVSVSGGFTAGGRYPGDTYKVVMPNSKTWGVRGEKLLKLIGGNLPERMYMAFLPVNDSFYLTGSNVSWTFGGGKAIVGEEGRSQHGEKAVLARRGDAKILELRIDPTRKSFTFYADGIPNTLSPTPEMAKRLKGGAAQAKDGTWLEGPLQARLHNCILKINPKGLDLGEDLARVKPADLAMFTNQVLGTVAHDFFHYGNNGYASGRFSEYAAELKKPAFVRRAILSGFGDLSRMDACGIIRNTSYSPSHSLAGGRIDCATMFEICVGICRGYSRLRGLLPPEGDRLYREAVTQMLVKQQGILCYQSNQWMHILEGFNEVFCATGDARLERALNMQLRAFIANDFHSKHGQTEAGFYSEECGPDGNYDQMSSRPMSVIYHTYSKQPAADPELVALMKDCLERNFRFRSIFAVPDPANGQPYQLAYAMNHRTDGPTHFDSHHTLNNCSNDFPMAYTIYALGQPWREASRCLKLPYETEGVSFEKPGFTALRRGNFYGVQFWKVYDEGTDGFLGPLFLWHAKAGMGLCGTKHSYGERGAHWFGPEMDANDLSFATVFGRLDGQLYVPSRRMRKTFAWRKRGRSYTVTGTQDARGTIAWTTDFVSDDAVEMEIAVDFPDLEDATVNIPFLKQNGRTVWSHEGWRPYALDGNRFVQTTRSGVFTVTLLTEGTKLEVCDTLYQNRGWALALRAKVPASGKVRVRIGAGDGVRAGRRSE